MPRYCYISASSQLDLFIIYIVWEIFTSFFLIYYFLLSPPLSRVSLLPCVRYPACGIYIYCVGLALPAVYTKSVLGIKTYFLHLKVALRLDYDNYNNNMFLVSSVILYFLFSPASSFFGSQAFLPVYLLQTMNVFIMQIFCITQVTFEHSIFCLQNTLFQYQ